MELKKETKDLHHSAEKHPIGASMADGTISAEWWAEWINALITIHVIIDPFNHPSMHRVKELQADYDKLDIKCEPNQAAEDYILTLINQKAIDGATYVFTGAHLMGGAMTARALQGRLPSQHLEWKDRKETMRYWNPLRSDVGLKDEANRAFKAVIDILDEIIRRYPSK